jgi:hypothetical protein
LVVLFVLEVCNAAKKPNEAKELKTEDCMAEFGLVVSMLHRG